MPETTAQKAALRRELLGKRQAIPPEVRAAMDAAIGERVMAWWSTHRAGTLGVYWPIRGEPDLRETYANLAAQGARLALPIVLDEDLPLRFIEWKPGDAMTRDVYGVAIPLTGAEVQPDALLIPCVGFNAQRFRLGYGGGFYDRTLAGSERPVAIGIGYECGRADFEPGVHDIALDTVITEASPI